jgi:23S rRNA pseudouridine1911/1915/1917 synthase
LEAPVPKPPYAERSVERVDVYDYRARRSMPGRRLDAYLAAKFANYSRTFLTGLVRDGKVTVNGRPVKPHYEVRRGDRIHIELPVFAKPQLVPEDIPVEILHEDDHVLIVNKPADLIVHPARSHMSGTLVNALLCYCESLPESDDAVRPGIVHRLDRDTTGVMVVVKDEASRGWIGRQFEWRKVEKHYRTVVEGEPELDADEIRLPLAKHRRQQEKMTVNRKHGREAVSVYRVIERFRGFAYLDVAPKTGRTHQIRVHLAAIGHPVVCDAVYGRRKELYRSELTRAPHDDAEEALIARQALHAYSLGFNHPGTRERATYTAPLPDDMQRLLAALREHRRTDAP